MREIEDEDIAQKAPNSSQQKAPKRQQEPEKTAAPKDETLKYECKYVNGGFNNGVKLEPTSGGKLLLSISIYGGGESKSIKIPVRGELQKIISGYESAFKSKDSLGTELEPEIDDKLQILKEEISNKIISAMKKFDLEVKQIIINTIKEI